MRPLARHAVEDSLVNLLLLGGGSMLPLLAAAGAAGGRPPAVDEEVQMRAREPDREGYVDRDGVKLHYEVFGDGPTTLLLLPAWTVVRSRLWKAQVPYPPATTGW